MGRQRVVRCGRASGGRGLALEVCLYVFQAAALGLRHAGSDEQEGDDGVAQEDDARAHLSYYPAVMASGRMTLDTEDGRKLVFSAPG